MNLEFTGILEQKEETNIISSTFKKREFIVSKTETVGQTEYTDYIKFELTQDKVNLLDNINFGDEIKVLFNLRGRKWEKDGKTSYFTNLQAWKIEKLNSTNNAINNFENENLEDDSESLPF